VRKGLEATGLSAAVTMRALVNLHTSVRTAEGRSPLQLLPYELDAKLSSSATDVEQVSAHLAELGLEQVSRQWHALLPAS
jgi:hypothetical protein